MPAVNSRGRGRRAMNEINMVPFIDVMLVLLIIFMVSAPLVTPSLIEIPSVGGAPRQPDRVITVEVDASARIVLRVDKDAPVTVDLKQLVERVRAIQGDSTNIPVVIAADKAVRYEQVMQVMDTLQRASIQRVGLVVRPAT